MDSQFWIKLCLFIVGVAVGSYFSWRYIDKASRILRIDRIKHPTLRLATGCALFTFGTCVVGFTAAVAIYAAVIIAIACTFIYVAFKILGQMLSPETEEQKAARKAQEALDAARKANEAAERKRENLGLFGSAMECLNCSHVVSKDAHVCPRCGGNPHEKSGFLGVYNTMECENCHHEVSKDATICPSCGGNPHEKSGFLGVYNTMECENCNHKVSKDATICPSCGGNPHEKSGFLGVYNTIECENCLHKVSKDATICPSCHHALQA